jgi:hypothetical protein
MFLASANRWSAHAEGDGFAEYFTAGSQSISLSIGG